MEIGLLATMSALIRTNGMTSRLSPTWPPKNHHCRNITPFSLKSYLLLFGLITYTEAHVHIDISSPSKIMLEKEFSWKTRTSTPSLEVVRLNCSVTRPWKESPQRMRDGGLKALKSEGGAPDSGALPDACKYSG